MSNHKENLARLRQKARTQIKRNPPADLTRLTAMNIDELVEDLHLHQIELEIQNEELELSRDHYQKLSERYQTLYDTAPVGYFTLTQSGYIRNANVTGATLLATTKGELSRRRFTDFIARNSQDIFFLHQRHLLKTQTRQVCELEMMTTDGTHFYGRLESVVLEDETIKSRHIHTALIELALKRQHDHLEEEVAARTAELAQANAQLQAEVNERQEAQTALQASHKHLEEALAALEASQQAMVQRERLAAVGQLTTGIAHDFNNILTSIMGYADLMLRQPALADSSTGPRIAIILEQSKRARHLVSQLLDFSHKSVRYPQAVELKSFLEDTIRLLTRTIPENTQIRLVCAPGAYWLNADPTQLQQLLINLALNARDAMPDGGVLTVGLASLTIGPDDTPPHTGLKPGRWLLLTITDSGTGIGAETLPHIFEPFFTTKAVGHGSGLGLAQVHGIVQQHGGDIIAESGPNQGATFTIYLPQMPPETREPLPALLEVTPQANGEWILVVEDEAEVLQVIRAMLLGLNYRVLTAVDGWEALALYRARKAEIAMVLTDKVMPDLDGIALCRALQAENPAVKVVVMSGYPLGGQADQALAPDRIHWLQKPVTLNELAAVLHQVNRQADAKPTTPDE